MGDPTGAASPPMCPVCQDDRVSTPDGPPGCPACLGRQTGHSFDWDYAASGRLHREGTAPALNVNAVRVVRSLKFGELLRCSACAQEYFRAPRRDGKGSQRWAAPISPDRREWFQRWDAGLFRPEPDVSEVLRTIGAVPGTVDGLGMDTISLPCAVRLTSGQMLDPALYQFRRSPPIEHWIGRVVWATEVREALPSRLALPIAVRIAGSQAAEIRMSFRPLPVLTSDGREFTLDGPEDFMDVPGVDAHSVRVRPWGSQSDIGGPLVHMPLERITFVIADWEPEDEALKLVIP